MKEWEEKFDQEQKLKEQEEFRREQKLKERVKNRIPNILEGKRKNNRNANVVKLGESVEETKQAFN